MNTQTWLSLTLASIAFTAGCDRPDDFEAAAPPPADGVVVQLEDLPASVLVDGAVSARRRAEVTTRMMARIAGVPVEVGDRVSTGQPLVHLDLGDVQANRMRAMAAVRSATAARDEAARQAARMDTLYGGDVVARAQRDGARLALTQAESQVALAQASLAEVETAAGYATIVAPFAGQIVSRQVDEGDMAGPGVLLLVIEDLGPRDGVFSVPADLLPTLTPGGRIRVTSGDRGVEAPIRAVAGGADPVTRTVEIRAVLPVDWPTGTAVTAHVPSGTVRGIAVPEAAVVRRGQLTGVRVVTPDGLALRWVRLGRGIAAPGGGERRVEVLSGLAPGDRIAL